MKMEEVTQEQQYFLELNTRLREFEERQLLLKDRLMLLSRGMIDIRNNPDKHGHNTKYCNN